MYMTVEMIPVIGLFALLAVAAGWAGTIYLSVRQANPMQDDAPARAAAPETFRAARAAEQARTSAAMRREARQAS